MHKTTSFYLPAFRPGQIKVSRLTIFLTLTVLFNCSLILYRNLHLTDHWWGVRHYTDLLAEGRGPSFLFLVWNLFLAWVPYGISLLIRPEQPRWWRYILLGAWLPFFPNAPYIITDLLHLQERLPVPLWYDMLTIFSFAWTGLIFGYLSLIRIQKHCFDQWGPVMSNLITAGVWLLAGLGIYIGRFLRWNSWDVLTSPRALVADLGSIFADPAVHWPAIGSGLLLSVLLFLGFATIREMR
ncbi:DUF1361 domain-containing protein [Flavilitoribacter nigricans]|nr:DUF1361 domain-containing protein [Flavilitoribacter nigricans]